MNSPFGGRWAEIERLLDRALDLAPDQRDSLIEQTRSEDAALGAALERLLGADRAAGRFLEEPATTYAAPLLAWAAEPEPLVPGTNFGPYEILRRLGRGATATVYLARDPKHRRSVAVKVLHPELAAAVGPERFLHEIEVAATLNHPHILPLFDSGAIDGLLYYVMPYVDGESLRGSLAKDRMPIDTAVRIAREVAGALDYSHRRGVVHRDIKPENILLQDGQAIVADFGIARAIDVAGADRFAEPGSGTGTPAYMSPEQACPGAEVDGRTDIYALGCVLYEMLAGEPPFTGPSPHEIRARHVTDPLPPLLRTMQPDMPASVEAVITKALAKAPADRFATAQEMGNALIVGDV
ncbi:MAG TPA: serine/threonine-protein kinase, partial [Gemmatimonadales bacterium]|nr:serine/threonine-protein kinase [Gemmatimonadales bacterium]